MVTIRVDEPKISAVHPTMFWDLQVVEQVSAADQFVSCNCACQGEIRAEAEMSEFERHMGTWSASRYVSRESLQIRHSGCPSPLLSKQEGRNDSLRFTPCWLGISVSSCFIQLLLPSNSVLLLEIIACQHTTSVTWLYTYQYSTIIGEASLV